MKKRGVMFFVPLFMLLLAASAAEGITHLSYNSMADHWANASPVTEFAGSDWPSDPDCAFNATEFMETLSIPSESGVSVEYTGSGGSAGISVRSY